MDLMYLPGWCIEYDRPATVAAHALSLNSSPESCVCDPCRNWTATRDHLFPTEFRELLERLGIPFSQDAEVYHVCRLDSGLHSYRAWYHFVGRVQFGERECSPNVTFGTFSVYFHSRPALVPQAFAGKPVVQLEVAAEVPWLSDLPEAS